MNFLKTFAASLLAVIVGSVLSGVLMLFVVGGIMAATFGSSAAKTPYVGHGTVLTIDVNQPIADAPEMFDFSIMAMGNQKAASIKLLDMLDAIERAATDERIEGIYLTASGGGDISAAQTEEIRAALENFKSSGKWVVGYAEGWSQLGYWLASVADELFVNPAGGLEWRGGSAQLLFFKGLIDKLGIDMQVLRHGSFKSAVEPFIMDHMSEANRLQVEKYLGSLWSVILEQVAVSRNVEVADLQKYADDLAILFPEDAVKYRLADGVLYEDQVFNYLSALVDGTAVVEDDEDVQYGSFEQVDAPHFVSIGDYVYARSGGERHYSKNRVAVVYINGEIVDGESARGSVGSATVVGQLRQVRGDAAVKAVVIRVNSPGGSAMASDIMWREISLLKAEKPVIVSMGEYAASGGYYVACGADAIMADRTTLTGSIGVFGLMPNFQKAMRDKLGVTVDIARTARHADIGTPFRPLDNSEREYIMRGIERVYTTFVGHVAQGRNMTPEAVDAIGQGRVWLAEDAARIGLVDGFGGLKDAIALAADRAGISDDYRVSEVTDVDTQMSLMMRMLFSTKIKVEVLGEDIQSVMAEYSAIKGMINSKGVQARLPFIVVNG